MPASDDFSDEQQKISEVAANGTEPIPISSEYVAYIKVGAMVIGTGAFGAVYKASDRSLNLTFAMKTVLLDLREEDKRKLVEKTFKTEIAVCMSFCLTNRFRSEQSRTHESNLPPIQTLSAAQHPNIIRLFAYHLDAKEMNHALVFEYANGGALDGYLAADSKRALLSSSMRLRIVHDVARALHYLHVGGSRRKFTFLHRDLKSANICLSKKDGTRNQFTAKLIDCGLGKFVDDENPSQSSMSKGSGSAVFGSEGYICPWYASGGKTFEPKCDVFSLGVVVMELITGCLQGGRSSRNGESFGYFHSRYVEDEEEQEEIENGRVILQEDADPVAAWELSVVGTLSKLAIDCCNPKRKKRPTADDVAQKVASLIYQDEFGEETSKQVLSTAGSGQNSFCSICEKDRHATKCSAGHGICGSCLDVQVARNLYAPIITCPVLGCHSHPFSATTLEHVVSPTVYQRYCVLTSAWQDIPDLLHGLHAKVDTVAKDAKIIQKALFRSIQGIANLTAGTTELCPRIMWLTLPAAHNVSTRRPGDWVKMIGRRPVHIYLVCQHSFTTLNRPIEIKVQKAWVEQIAPCLRLSLILLKTVSQSVGLPLPVDVSSFTEQLQLQKEFLDDVLEETQSFAFDQLESLMEKESSALSTDDLLARDGGRVKHLVGTAYSIMAEKLTQEQRSWWQNELKPVLDADGSMIYVKNQYAGLYRNDPSRMQWT